MTDDETPIPDGMSEPAADVVDLDFAPPESVLVQDTPGVSEITGGEGYGVVRRRNLLVLVPLPVYYIDADRRYLGFDKAAERANLDSDIRVAMAQAARKLNDTAMKYSVTGYEWDLYEIQYDMPRPRTLSATLVIERK